MILFNQQVSDLLKGSIDLHVHLNPHMAPETHVMDVEEYAEEARKVAMRGALIKDAAFPTTSVAYLVNKHFDDFKFYGSVMLNLYQGGLNSEAVRVSLNHGDGAKMIFFPTGDSYQHICARYRFYRGINLLRPKEEGIRIIQSGQLVPEALKILDIIAEANICLATGHLSPEETKMLVKEAKRRGVKKIIISHALWKMIGFTQEELIELSQEDAYIEFEFGMCLPIMFFNHGEPTVNPLETAELIRRIGADRCLMTTDCGQVYSPSPVEAMRYYIAVMLKCDLEPKEIETMIKKNPAILLGLPEWESNEMEGKVK